MATNYLDFYVELQGDRLEDAKFCIHTETSGPKSEVGEVKMRLNPSTIEATLDELERFVAPDTRTFVPDPKDVETLQRKLGTTLYRAVFNGKARDQYFLHRGRLSADPDLGMRIRIVTHKDAEEIHPLVALPWELMRGEASFEGRFGTNRELPISRGLLGLRPRPVLETHRPLRILLVQSNPVDQRPIATHVETNAIKEALRDLDKVELFEAPPNLEAIRDTLKMNDITALHWMGHGDAGDGRNYLIMEDGKRESLNVFAHDLADHLSKLKALKLIVLAGCRTARTPTRLGQNMFESIAPTLLCAGINAVVGMQLSIFDPPAIEFSRRFYTCVAQGDPVDVAATEARLAISKLKNHPIHASQWSLPVVFLAGKDGRLVQPRSTPPMESPRPAPVASGEPEATGESPLRLGIRSFVKGWGEGLEKELDRFLSLDAFFPGRNIRSPEQWNEAVRPRVLEFLEKFHPKKKSLEIYLPSHISIGFTAGWGMPVKQGLRIRIAQPQPQGGGWQHWAADQGNIPQGELWNVEHTDIHPGGTDVACAVALTHRNVYEDVVAFIEDHCPHINRLIHVFPIADQGHEAVKSGAHCYHLASDLVKILGQRSLDERRRPLHLFIAGPNAFSFFLGQQAHALSKIQLYEYPMGEGRVGWYWPSIALPPASR